MVLKLTEALELGKQDFDLRELTLAIEIVASINLRLIRDAGCTEEEYGRITALAIETSGVLYERIREQSFATTGRRA